MADLFKRHAFSEVIYLGALVRVRYSSSHPHTYIDSNVRGTLNILEGCRHYGIKHLVLASTSSVYGLNRTLPFSPHHGVDHPVSLYASTKRAGELMGHNYAELFGMPVTALRFFTVYGPWGRPDMSPILFAKKMSVGEPIDVFNHGCHCRDFTFIDDIVEGVVRVTDHVPTANAAWDAQHPDPASSRASFRVFKIGNRTSVELMTFIELLERALGVTAEKRFLPAQPGDVEDTFADMTDLETAIGYAPKVAIEKGVERFVQWFKGYADRL